MLILIENWLIRLSDRLFLVFLHFPTFSWKCSTIVAFSLLNVIYAIKIQKFSLVASLTQILKHINYILKHYFDRVRRNIGIFKFILMKDFNE